LRNFKRSYFVGLNKGNKKMIAVNRSLVVKLLIAYWASTAAVIAAVAMEPIDVGGFQDSLGMRLVADLPAGLIGAVLLLLMIAATVGIFKEKFWGKHLFLLTNFAGLLLTGLMGYLILAPTSALLDGLNTMVTGALILASYAQGLRSMTCLRASGDGE
jgi:hypothetical protein